MNTFACIDFINNPILLPKGELLKLKRVPAYLQEKKIHKEKGYHLYITKQKGKLSRRCWNQIEKQLLKRGVYYFVSSHEEIPFTQLQKVTGERIPFLLSKYILEYIFKYNLLQKDEKYVKIGVVVGQKKETLDTIGPILGSITDLTLLTKDRDEYRGIKEEIYKTARIKPKIFLPSPKVLSQMDVIFDAQREESYVNQCSPRAIYIDSYKNIARRKMKILRV